MDRLKRLQMRQGTGLTQHPLRRKVCGQAEEASNEAGKFSLVHSSPPNDNRGVYHSCKKRARLI